MKNITTEIGKHIYFFKVNDYKIKEVERLRNQIQLVKNRILSKNKNFVFVDIKTAVVRYDFENNSFRIKLIFLDI